jgi:hypothetical protein
MKSNQSIKFFMTQSFLPVLNRKSFDHHILRYFYLFANGDKRYFTTQVNKLDCDEVRVRFAPSPTGKVKNLYDLFFFFIVTNF